MSATGVRALAPGYSVDVDGAEEQSWGGLVQNFDDSNIYQTWSHASVISGQRNISHLILRKDGEVVAVGLARLTRIPLLNVGTAYLRWGPLWQRKGCESDPEVFRQMVRGLRNEFVCKRRLVLRLFPSLFSHEAQSLSTILQEEGFSLLPEESAGRTILMNLEPSLDDLRAGMKPHWKRELKVAEKNGLELLEGTSDDLFQEFIRIYKEMVARKQFVEPNDINQFRLIQSRLPENLKMGIMLCRLGDDVCSGLIYSAMGNKAVYLFGATSDSGMRSRGSYFLQWKLLERLKQQGITIYDLNGINPQKNPGTYKFKDDLAGSNGTDVSFAGRFDSYTSQLRYGIIQRGETIRKTYRSRKWLAGVSGK